MTLSASSIAKLGLLYAPLANAAKKMAEIAAMRGIQFTITQGFRSVEEQNRLYAQGRSSPGQIVTKAPGGKSWHNYGLAFDLVIVEPDGSLCWDDEDKRWKELGSIGASCGLEWGGHWTGFKDLPHFQWPMRMSYAEAYQIFKDGGTAAVWAELDKKEATAT